MKDSAGYCTEVLQRAMEETERRTEEVRQSMLGDMDVEALMDQALRMAIINKTSGTAKQFVQNNKTLLPEWTGLEHWRTLILQFDPINTRMAQEERSDVMKGAVSRNWVDFESKLIQ